MSSSSIDTLPAGDHPLVNIGTVIRCFFFFFLTYGGCGGLANLHACFLYCHNPNPSYTCAATPTRTAGDLRALVVEDDPLNLMVIRKLLSMSGVASIDVARNGAEVCDRVACVGRQL